jgi:hypothetical protein
MAKTKLSETNSKPHRVTVPDAGAWDDFFLTHSGSTWESVSNRHCRSARHCRA